MNGTNIANGLGPALPEPNVRSAHPARGGKRDDGRGDDTGGFADLLAAPAPARSDAPPAGDAAADAAETDTPTLPARPTRSVREAVQKTIVPDRPVLHHGLSPVPHQTADRPATIQVKTAEAAPEPLPVDAEPDLDDAAAPAAAATATPLPSEPTAPLPTSPANPASALLPAQAVAEQAPAPVSTPAVTAPLPGNTAQSPRAVRGSTEPRGEEPKSAQATEGADREIAVATEEPETQPETARKEPAGPRPALSRAGQQLHPLFSAMPVSRHAAPSGLQNADGNQNAPAALAAAAPAGDRVALAAREAVAVHLRPAQQIANAVEHAVSAGRDHLKLRLHPEELGEVDVTLRIQDGIFKVTITSHRPDTLQQLQDNQQALERALNEMGFGQEKPQLEFAQGGDGSRGGRDEDAPARRFAASAGLPLEGAAAPAATYRTDGLVDIKL